MRRDVDGGSIEAGRHEEVTNRHRPLQPERKVRLLRPHRVGVPDDDDVLDRMRFHRRQNLGDERARFVRQLVRLEPEEQGEVTRRGRQRRQRVAEDALHVRLAQLVRTGRAIRDSPTSSRVRRRGRRIRMGSRRSRSRSARVRVRKQHDQVLRRANGAGDALRAARRRDRDGERGQPRLGRVRLAHYGTTRIASVVPLTPMIAAGVSRRMESGASFAIRPET